MKKEIIKLLGKNHTDPVVFEKDGIEIGAIYTYKGDIFCLEGGMDFPFEDVSKDGQLEIFTEIKANRYRVDNSFQG